MVVGDLFEILFLVDPAATVLLIPLPRTLRSGTLSRILRYTKAWKGFEAVTLKILRMK